MSYRHMHITSFITDTTGLRSFLRVARDSGLFADVMPLARPEDGRVTAVAFWSKDLDSISDELAIEGITAALSGILSEDIEIVTAWEGGAEKSDQGRERQHVRQVPARRG